jgi:hypothetical protein
MILRWTLDVDRLTSALFSRDEGMGKDEIPDKTSFLAFCPWALA